MFVTLCYIIIGGLLRGNELLREKGCEIRGYYEKKDVDNFAITRNWKLTTRNWKSAPITRNWKLLYRPGPDNFSYYEKKEVKSFQKA